MKISIALATYNGERFIREQLDSLAAQTRLPDELVVTDDGSSDRTLEIVERFKSVVNFPVHVYRNEHNLGYGDNFLKAASLCTGDWIAFCDQDDVWLTEKLATLERYAEESPPDLFLITHCVEVVYDSLERTGVIWPRRSKREVAAEHKLSPWWLAFGMATFFRAELLTKIPFNCRGVAIHHPPDMMGHDQWITWLVRMLGQTMLVPDCLALYRRHGATTTKSMPDSNEAIKKYFKPRQRLFRLFFTACSDKCEWYAEVAYSHSQALAKLSKRVNYRDWEKRIRYEVGYFEALALWLKVRAQLYRERSLRRRVIRLWRLARYGEYVRFSGGVRSGASAFAKDLLITLVGRNPLFFAGAYEQF